MITIPCEVCGNDMPYDSRDITVMCSECRKKVEQELEGIIVKHDAVHHPSHYTQGGIETIDFMQAKLGREGFEGYLAGNVLKYMTRYQHKNGLEDPRKAAWYLDKLIEVKSS